LLLTDRDFLVLHDPSAVAAEDPAEVILWDLGAQSLPLERPKLMLQIPTLALVRDREAAFEALGSGAAGVLLRNAEGSRLLPALRAVAAGVSVFEPALLREWFAARAGVAGSLALTPRELEVLHLLAEGLSNRLIGVKLSITEHTVKFHVNAILSKLGADTRTEAVVIAARRGLVML
jgi:two-component system nitrate/nitrite response regulator NarL